MIFSCHASLVGDPRDRHGPSAAIFSTAIAQDPIFVPGDPIIAIDTDEPLPVAPPESEPPAKAIDSDPFTKYLNFGKENSGFIVTPTDPTIGPELSDNDCQRFGRARPCVLGTLWHERRYL